ncbi:Transcription initiation factor TFIID subunit 5 [Dictyocoela muelleri]|nr:Transcription initiation factor TFIID subunit 5 [Dictyocoela muelleri]
MADTINQKHFIDVKSFFNLRIWVEASLDQIKNELYNILYPLFIHIYIDLIRSNNLNEANNFFEKNKDFHTKEALSLKGLTPMYLSENPVVMAFKNNKYHIQIGKSAFDLLLSFLEDNEMVYVLKMINQYIDIKVSAIKKEIGILGCEVYDEPVDLSTWNISKETENIILNDEKYENMENMVSTMKKKEINPSPSYIREEIESIKDLCKRVNVSKNNLPSACCYTVFNSEINAACFSDDTRLLAVAYDTVIEVVSLDKPLLKLKSSDELKNTANLDEDAFVELGHVARLIGHSEAVYGLCFFKTKKNLLSCSGDGTAKLWSLELMSCLATYKAHVFPVWCCTISYDDFYFAIGSADRLATVWSVISNSPERILLGALSDISAIKFHPNGNYIFTGSCDMKIRMHEIQEGKVLKIFIGHQETVTCLAISQCGKFLLSGSRDKNLILWDINTSKQLIKYNHETVVYDCSFCYYGNLIASCGENSVKIWDRTDIKGVCLKTYFTKNTCLASIKFGFRNIISCVGNYKG